MSADERFTIRLYPPGWNPRTYEGATIERIGHSLRFRDKNGTLYITTAPYLATDGQIDVTSVPHPPARQSRVKGAVRNGARRR